MENALLPWRADSSSSSSFGQGEKLGMVLLLSSGDAEDCCAKNFERTVFRDEKVVKYSKNNLISYRLDRSTGAGAQLYSTLKLKAEKPAIVVLDSDGEVLYKTQLCANPKDCLLGFQKAAALSAARTQLSLKAEQSVDRARALIQEKKYSGAVDELVGINVSAGRLRATTRERVTKHVAAMEKLAHKHLVQADEYLAKQDFARAGETYRTVAKNFSKLDKKIRSRAQAGLSKATSGENASTPVARS